MERGGQASGQAFWGAKTVAGEPFSGEALPKETQLEEFFTNASVKVRRPLMNIKKALKEHPVLEKQNEQTRSRYMKKMDRRRKILLDLCFF